LTKFFSALSCNRQALPTIKMQPIRVHFPTLLVLVALLVTIIDATPFRVQRDVSTTSSSDMSTSTNSGMETDISQMPGKALSKLDGGKMTGLNRKVLNMDKKNATNGMKMMGKSQRSGDESTTMSPIGRSGSKSSEMPSFDMNTTKESGKSMNNGKNGKGKRPPLGSNEVNESTTPSPMMGKKLGEKKVSGHFVLHSFDQQTSTDSALKSIFSESTTPK
jgi:hypothetical protein